jgi:hypothetical protein
MDGNLGRGDNAELHPTAVRRQDRNRDVLANGDSFSMLATKY